MITISRPKLKSLIDDLCNQFDPQIYIVRRDIPESLQTERISLVAKKP